MSIKETQLFLALYEQMFDHKCDTDRTFSEFMHYLDTVVDADDVE